VEIRGEDPVFESSVYIFAVGFVDGIEQRDGRGGSTAPWYEFAADFVGLRGDWLVLGGKGKYVRWAYDLAENAVHWCSVV
jgi:hypothetical protein